MRCSTIRGSSRLATSWRARLRSKTPYDILASHRAALPVIAVLSDGSERGVLAKAEFLFDGVHDIMRKIDDIDAYFDS